MDHIPRVSKVLYAGLCWKIGTPTEVGFRRDVRDIFEMIREPFYKCRNSALMESGSWREGFRFDSSDRDCMYWFCNYKLITDICQSHVCNESTKDVILMEDSDTPPGFVKLRLLTPPRQHMYFTIPCLRPINDGNYISSFLWSKRSIPLFANSRQYRGANMDAHGPCVSGNIGSIEFDFALSFASLCWPKLLRVWVDRCRSHAWPPAPVLETILKNGYHCVPVGSKIESTSNDLEWRLSFSQAEKHIVFTMNHTQFLCYGLLKIFLTEVLNQREEPKLLCSYFMKTTMFWIIQLGNFRWCPNNLLDCFWKCFKYLIQCVYRGVFPNFFIPQNNMFINKVIGEAREYLLEHLFQYYRMGVSCLLLSPTLRSILEPALSNPLFEGRSINIVDGDISGMIEIFQIPLPVGCISDSYLFLKSIEKVSKLWISPFQILTIQFCTAETLVNLARVMEKNAPLSFTRKSLYNFDRVICNTLKLASRLGPVSTLLFLALYYFRTERYGMTLRITYLAKQRLSHPYVICDQITDTRVYSAALCNLSLFRKMNKAWANTIHLENDDFYLEELCLEQDASEQNGEILLHLSPYLLVDMLLVLPHYRLGHISRYLQTLTDLQTKLVQDDRRYVPVHFRDISWQILGICQHIVGDLHGALRSYQESLRHEAFHRIREATDIRIRRVKQQLYRNINSEA
ncbi:uncharacterized protein LOC134235604 [Saccostrea cucullata]|uniref:uncharacterized protein LOC134235604 n=1 Tax=Saccostrea cuccullata TaxID=36930 RepID=UPI002ED3304F